MSLRFRISFLIFLNFVIAGQAFGGRDGKPSRLKGCVSLLENLEPSGSDSASILDRLVSESNLTNTETFANYRYFYRGFSSRKEGFNDLVQILKGESTDALSSWEFSSKVLSGKISEDQFLAQIVSDIRAKGIKNYVEHESAVTNLQLGPGRKKSTALFFTPSLDDAYSYSKVSFIGSKEIRTSIILQVNADSERFIFPPADTVGVDAKGEVVLPSHLDPKEVTGLYVSIVSGYRPGLWTYLKVSRSNKQPDLVKIIVYDDSEFQDYTYGLVKGRKIGEIRIEAGNAEYISLPPLQSAKKAALEGEKERVFKTEEYMKRIVGEISAH